MNEPKITRKRLKREIPKAGDLELVLVVWHDAALGEYDGPTHAYDADGLCVNVSAGFLLRENKQRIVLMVDSTPKDNTVRWPYEIPRSLVQKIVRTGIRAHHALDDEVLPLPSKGTISEVS